VLSLLLLALTLISQEPQDTVRVDTVKVEEQMEVYRVERPADTLYLELTKQQKLLEQIIIKKKKR